MIDKARLPEIKARCDKGEIKAEDMKWLICELEICLYEKAKKNATALKYYHAHHEKCVAKARKFREEHHDEVIEYKKTWAGHNEKKIKAYRKKCYQKRKEKAAAEPKPVEG